LIEPIVISKGQIIDGRNRYRACRELGIEPHFVEWSTFNYRHSVQTWIWAKNIERRHLTSDQRVMMATMFEDWAERETAAALRKTEVLRTYGRGRSKRVNQKSGSPLNPHERSTAGQIAATAKVSRYKAEQAIAVAKRNPAVAPRVLNGEVKLKDALPPVKRKEFDIDREVRRMAASVRAWVGGIPSEYRPKCLNLLVSQIKELKPK